MTEKELVTRLRDLAATNSKDRSLDEIDEALDEAADALTTLAAEKARMREALENIKQTLLATHGAYNDVERMAHFLAKAINQCIATAEAALSSPPQERGGVMPESADPSYGELVVTNDRLLTALSALRECCLQIEYLQSKFQETGSGNAVLTRGWEVYARLVSALPTQTRHTSGCECHGVTFCPDLKFSHYEDEVPVFVRKEESGG